MNRTSAIVLWLSACVLAAFAQDVVFRSDVHMVNVTATVRDSKGGIVGGLTADEFRIADGGEEQKIVVFERQTDRPLSIVLLVDSSSSTAIELEFERASAKQFVGSLFGAGAHERDRLALMKFSEGVELLTGFTRSERTIGRTLDRIRAETGTSLYDGVLLASQELDGRPGRRVLIIVTDGGDTTSYSTFQQAIEEAQNADVVIYSIIVMPVKADAGRNVGGERTLWMFAEGTGGKAFVEYGEKGLNRVFNEILENLRTQYLLAYYPPAHDDPRTRYRPIEVTVDRPGATVLARSGYYVPEEKGILPESATPSRVDVERRGAWRPATPEEAKKAADRDPQ